MIKFRDTQVLLSACVLMMHPFSALSNERLLEASINSRVLYDDNLFLTTAEHDAVTGIIITPSLTGIIKEENWEAKLNTSLKFNEYSDRSTGNNGQFFDLTGRYNVERNSFSLNVNHDLDNNLNSGSTDFGIAGRRVDRKTQSVTSGYTRSISERLILALSYTYSDVDYLNAENTNFTPSFTNIGSVSLQYALTEKDLLSLSWQALDYTRKDNLGEVQLFDLLFGLDHKFSEVLSTNFKLGASRRNSTNRQTQIVNFFGQIALQPLEIDVRTRGLLLDAGLTQLLERGQLEGRISRDNTTNSFGGVDQVDRFTLNYDEKLSLLWSYDLSARYEDISSISSSGSATDRNTINLEAKIYYSINLNWRAVASYRYSQRRFKSDTSDSRAPHSNRIYIGLTYNFPSLSTF